MAKAKKDSTRTPIKKDSFMALARERFTKLQVPEAEIRKDAIENLNFVYNVGDGHWPKNIRTERELDSRPCLTSNKLRKYVAQVANRERDMRMAGRVRPVDDKADVPTAKVIEGLIRQIEYTSNANTIRNMWGNPNAMSNDPGYKKTLDYYANMFQNQTNPQYMATNANPVGGTFTNYTAGNNPFLGGVSEKPQGWGTIPVTDPYAGAQLPPATNPTPL